MAIGGNKAPSVKEKGSFKSLHLVNLAGCPELLISLTISNTDNTMPAN
jgi:hypothetical protein